MRYKIVHDVDDGFGDRTQACREDTLLGEEQISRIYATIPGQAFIGPVLQVEIIRSSAELKFRFLPHHSKSEHPGWSYAEEKPLRGGVTSQ